MARLPQPGGDSGNWGTILNDYLAQSHKADGTLKDDVVTSAAIADGAITSAQLDPAIQSSLSKANTALQSIADGAITTSKIAADSVNKSQLTPSLRTEMDGKITASVASELYSPKGNKIVLLGNSRIAREVADGAPWQFTDLGIFTLANTELGSRFNVVNSAGISGQSTDMFITRFASDVAAYNPDWVLIADPVNDVSAGATDVQIINRMTTLIGMCKEINARAIVLTCPPNGGHTTIQKQYVNNFNRWVKWGMSDYWAIPIDVASAVTNPQTGNWQAGTSNDDLHQNRGGSSRMARVVASVLAPLIPYSDPFPSSPTDSYQLLSNPWNYMASPGALPAAYTGTGTATYSTVARSDFISGTWMQIDTSAGSANCTLGGPGGGGVNLSGGFVEGAKVRFITEFQIDPWTSFNGLGIGCQLRSSTGTVLKGIGLASVNTWSIMSQDRWSQGKTWIFTSPITTIPAGTTAAKVVQTWNGQGVVRFGRQALILVD